MSRRILTLVITSVLLTVVTACGNVTLYTARSDSEKQSARSQNQSASKQPASPSRDLSQDEAAGGHVLKRHVGRTDDQLRDRLQHEHISAASTYTDRATAEQAVGAAIASNNGRIQNWLSRSGGHPNLVLDYDSPTPIGRTLYRNELHSTPCSHALVVLKWKSPSDYYVLTSYPECKP